MAKRIDTTLPLRWSVEVETVVVPHSDTVVWQVTVHIRLPKEMVGQRVKVLVIKEDV